MKLSGTCTHIMKKIVTVTSLYDYTSFSPTEELYCLKERRCNLCHCGGV